MATITAPAATLVHESRRLAILPKYAGEKHMLLLEAHIFHAMREHCAEYQGGYWYMYEISNGAFYMAPGRDERLNLSVAGNYFDGEMSADAAGIVACLFAFNRLAGSTREVRFINLFHALREFAAEHEEAGQILRAID